jgi:hypothetical protein
MMIATLARIGLCGILKRPQIVADRYDRKEDDDEHDQSDKRHAPLGLVSAIEAKPKTHDDDCHRCPCAIEELLHAHPKFYIRG